MLKHCAPQPAGSNTVADQPQSLWREISRPPPLMMLALTASLRPLHQLMIQTMRFVALRSYVSFDHILETYNALMLHEAKIRKTHTLLLTHYPPQPQDVNSYFTRLIITCALSVKKLNVNLPSVSAQNRRKFVAAIKILCNQYLHRVKTPPPLISLISEVEKIVDTPQSLDEDYKKPHAKVSRKRDKLKNKLQLNMCVSTMHTLDNSKDNPNTTSTDRSFRSGLMFLDLFHKDVLLNEALLSLHWEQVPYYLSNLQLFKPSVNSDSERILFKEFTQRMKQVCQYHLTLTEDEARFVQDFFVLAFSDCTPMSLQNIQYPEVLIPNYHFNDHPEICMPHFPLAALNGKQTRTKFIEPVVETGTMNADEPNVLYHLMSQFKTKSHILTVQKIKSICKSALASGQDPTKCLRDRCVIWSESETQKSHSRFEGRNELWNLEQRDVEHLSWFMNFIRPDMFLQVIAIDDPKSNNPFVRHRRYFQYLRQMVIQCRDNLIEFAHQYSVMYHLPEHLKRQCRAEFRNSFKEIMQSPQVQMLFMTGESKGDIIKNIYNQNIIRIKKQAFKLDSVQSSQLKRKKITKQLIAKSRVAKVLQRDEDMYQTQANETIYEVYTNRTTYEAGLFTPNPEVGRVSQNWSLWPFWTSIFVSAAYIVYKVLDGTAKTVYDKVAPQVTKLRETAQQLEWFKRVFASPAMNAYNKINSIVLETRQFIGDNDYKLSPETTIVYVELIAVINIVYAITMGSLNQALAHTVYFGATRANMLKECILSFTAQPAEVEPTFNWHYRGEDYILNLDQYQELEVMNRIPNLRQEVYERFAADLDIVEPQAVDDMFKSIFKPLAKLVTSFTDGDMDEKHIRDANANYQYLNHKGAWLTEQAELIKNVIYFILQFFFGFNPNDSDWMEYTSKMYRMMDFIEAHYKKMNHLMVDKPLMEEILRREPEVIELSRDHRLSLVPVELRNYFNRRLRMMEKMIILSHAYLNGTHNRDTPVMLVFTGPPGVGKTTAMDYIRTALATILQLPVGPQGTYVLNPDNEFHEGYSNQPFVYMDDLFKSAEIPKRAIEATNIIHMVNTAPYNMPMAFESKGVVFFDSQFIMGTTNIANKGYQAAVWQVGLTDPTAMLRRFHIVVHREEVYNGQGILETKFTVQKCDLMPQYVGRSVNPQEIAIIMLEHRKAFSNQAQAAVVTPETIEQHFGDIQALRRLMATRKDLLNDPELIPEQQAAMIQPELGQEGEDADIEEVFEVQDAPIKPPTIAKMPDLEANEYLTRALKIKFDGKDIDDVQVIRKIKWYSAIFFLLLTLLTLVSVWYFWTDDSTQTKDTKTRRATRHRNQRVSAASAVNRVAKSMNVKTTTQSDESNYMLSLISNVSKCTVLFSAQAYDKSGNYIQGSGSEAHGFHYRDGIFFVPAHFVTKFLDQPDWESKMCLKWQGGRVTIPWPDLYHIQDEDACFFRISDLKNPPKALKKYVWKRSDLAEIGSGTPMQLVGMTSDMQPNIKNLTKACNTGPIEYKDKYGKKFKVNFCINYYENTEKGESGKLVTLAARQGSPQVIGFHVCLRETNTQKYGFALAFTQDCLDDVIKQVNLENVEEVITDTTQHYNTEIPFPPLYRVPADKAHFPPTRSKLTPSSMHEWNGPSSQIPVRMSPFVDKNGVTKDPLLIGMSKLRTVHTPPTPVPDSVKEYLFKEYPKPFVTPKLFTHDECLKGIPGTNVPSINVGTSAGYPYSLARKKGKTAYIDIIDNTFEYKQEFLDSIIEEDDMLRSGQQIKVIFADVLKDETRPIAKVEAGKTRLFSTCPLNYLVHVRKYFGPLLSFIKERSAESPICVGLTAQSIEWENVYRKMMAKSGSIISADFENWDGSIPKFIADVVVEWINEWFDDGHINARVRTLLCAHMTEAVHICNDVVYQTYGSGPTGNPMTSEWNSLIQMVCNYIVLTEDLKLDPEDFEQKVYGDDGLLAIVRAGIKVNDLKPHYLRRFGMKMTHWSKVEDDANINDTLETIQFIGRMFVPDDCGNIKAPLPMDTIVEMWYWVEGNGDDSMQMISAADSFFSELAQYPKPIFDQMSERCLRAVNERIPHLVPEILKRKLMYSTYIRRMYFGGSSREEFKIQSKDSNLVEGTLFGDNIKEGETDRAINEPSATQKVDLGSFNDVAPILETEVNKELSQQPYNTPNMEVNTFNDTLDRVFNLGNPSWTTAQAAGTVIASFSFPQQLFNQTFIADKINDFRAFEGAVQINVRITAARTLYGKLMLVYYPFREYYPVGSAVLQTFVPNTNIYARTGNPHILADASSSDVVTLTVPFTSPNRYLDLYKYGNSEMGYFQLVVMNPLTNTEDATSNAVVVVTAGFVGGKVYIPTDTSSGPTALRARYAEKVGSLEEKERLQLESESEMFTTQSSEGMSNRQKVSNARATTAKNIEAVRKIQTPDAQKEVHQHVQSGMDTLKLFGRTLGNFAMNVAQDVAATAIVGALGLSKPTTLNTTAVVTNNPHFHINNGKGIDTTMKLAIDNENMISTMPNVAGLSADEMALSFIQSMPSMVTQTTWLPGSTPLMIATTGTDTNLSFIDHLKLQHSFWSGSHKFKLYITASIFHSVRFVFYMALNSTSDWQVCHHQVVEVQGSTEVEMTVPYYPQQIASWISDTSTPYSLYCQILSWSQADMTLSNPIYINTYKAGASDFQFAAPRDVRYTLQSNPREDFNHDFDPIHPSVVGYGQTNLIFGEKLDTIRLHVHKLTPIATVVATATNNDLITWPRAPAQVFIGVDMYGLFYRFWRGSIRFKFVYKKSAAAFGALYIADTANGYQGVGLNNPMVNSVECEVPYYSPCLIENTSTTPNLNRRLYKSNGDVSYLFKAAGDDFSFHWLVLPPLGTYTTAAATTTGTAGYSTFN